MPATTQAPPGYSRIPRYRREREINMMMSIIVRENIPRLRRAALHLINAAADNAYQGSTTRQLGK
jgi:hypothetical protein